MGYPTNLTFGVATVPQQSVLGFYPLPDPFNTASTAGFSVATYAQDFFDLGLANTTTLTGGTLALADGAGGVAVLTPSGATTTATASRAAAAWAFVVGMKTWFTTRIKVSAVTGVGFATGLTASTGGTVSTANRVYFEKAAGGTTLNLVAVVNNVTTTLLSGLAVPAADTFLELGLYYDGLNLLAFVDGNLVGRVASATIGASGTNLPSALLTPYATITPTATQTLSLDYQFVARELVR